jgi:hypothetical protein
MEISLTKATKLHTLPKILDRLNSFGSPTVKTSLCPINGEGSSFLALPTKRNNLPAANLATKSLAQVEQILDKNTFDFKAVLEPLLLEKKLNGTDANPELPTDNQWLELNQLRVHAGAPERSEQGVQKLMQYYAQLCWLEDMFPFGTGQVCSSEAKFPF